MILFSLLKNFNENYIGEKDSWKWYWQINNIIDKNVNDILFLKKKKIILTKILMKFIFERKILENAIDKENNIVNVNDIYVQNIGPV